LLHRCLTKDPDRRLRDLGDAALEIEDAPSIDEPAAGREAPTLRPQPEPRARAAAVRRAVPWVIAVAAVVLAALALARRPTPNAPTSTMRLELAMPNDAPLQLGGHPAAVLSPNGQQLVHVARLESGPLLFLHDLATGSVSPITGTENAQNPSFSPHGEWIAFTANNTVRKVPIQGGPVTELAPTGLVTRGTAWLDDDTILLGSRTGITRVSAAGGAMQQLTQLDSETGELSHYWPFVLPGQRAVLYVAGVIGSTSYDQGRVFVYDFESGEPRRLLEGGTSPRYVDSGHLVFARDGKLYAAPFDLATLQITGQQRVVVDGVMMRNDSGGVHYSTSSDGHLVFVRGGAWELSTVVERRARDGTLLPVAKFPEGLYASVRVAPDGRHLALTRYGPNDDIWVADRRREFVTRITFGEGGSASTVWSPDGRSIAFSNDSDRAMSTMYDISNIYVMQADGSDVQRLTRSSNNQWPSSWTDSKLAFMERRPETGIDIRVLELDAAADADSTARISDFLATPFNERWPAFSPDGRWIAYVSDESGTAEVYVRPFPGPGGKVRISTAGGGPPRWAPDGAEIFWTRERNVMAARVSTTPVFSVSRPQRLFEMPYLAGTGFAFDIDRDGESFLLLRDAHEFDTGRVVLVLGWTHELRSQPSSQP
jgi:serine/threonine-protein kinase